MLPKNAFEIVTEALITLVILYGVLFKVVPVALVALFTTIYWLMVTAIFGTALLAIAYFVYALVELIVNRTS